MTKPLEKRIWDIDAIEIRAKDDGGKMIVGHAAVFNRDSLPIWDLFVERVLPGAFARALREKQDVIAAMDHNPERLLGRSSAGTLRLAEDRIGLGVEIDTPDTSAGRDALVSIGRGDIRGMSFQFRVREEKWTHAKAPGEYDLRELVDVDLIDVAPTAMPAYPDTDAAVRSYKAWAQSQGHDPAIIKILAAVAERA